MPETRKIGNGHHGYAAPVAGIVLLLVGYWLITEWKSLPGLFRAVTAAFH